MLHLAHVERPADGGDTELSPLCASAAKLFGLSWFCSDAPDETNSVTEEMSL